MRVLSITSSKNEAHDAGMQCLVEADVGLVVALGDGRIEYANASACRLLGNVMLTGQRLQQFVTLLGPEHHELARRVVARLGSEQAPPIKGAVVQLRLDRGCQWMRIDVLRSGKVAGQPRWLLMLVAIGSVQANTSVRLQAYAGLKQMLDATPVGICMSDDQGLFEYVNHAFQQFCGYNFGELLGTHISSMVPVESRTELAGQYRRFITSGDGLCGEWPLLDNNGGKRVVKAEACRIMGPDGRYQAITLFVDITERKALEHELREKNRVLAQIASSDSLTGLYNRRFTLEALRKALLSAERYDRPLMLAMIDLDEFKAVNDQHGHAVGDEVLVAFARLIRNSSRDSDICGRIGGEEFIMIIPESDSAGVCQLLDRLRGELQALRFSVPGLSMNFSAGVYARQDGDNVALLLRRADQALYAAKRQGRGCQRVWHAD